MKMITGALLILGFLVALGLAKVSEAVQHHSSPDDVRLFGVIVGVLGLGFLIWGTVEEIQKARQKAQGR